MGKGGSHVTAGRFGVRRRAVARARQLVENSTAPLREIVDLARILEQDAADLSVRLRQVEARLEEVAKAIERPSGAFAATMTMSEVLRRHPSSGRVLLELGLPDCTGCSVRFDETLAEAAHAYGFNLAHTLARLQQLVR